MPILVKPTVEELNYRKKLLESSRTMDFNHHTVSFPEEDWQKFLDEVVESRNYCYRFIYCNGCNDYRGIALYRYDACRNEYYIHITVEADARKEGYGSAGLALMEEEARKAGVSILHASVYPDNTEGCRFALKHGYTFCRSENGKNIYRKIMSH